MAKIKRKPLDKILDALSLTESQRNDLQYYIETCGGKINPLYNNLNQVTDYLFELNYNHLNIDYDYANNYFKTKYKDIKFGFCSSIRSLNYLFRNFDWKYSTDIDFVVKTNKLNGRFKSIAVASTLGLSNDFVNSGEYSDRYKLLPFFIVDGINENGVAVSINVCSKDFGHTNQHICGRKEMCALMIPRYILDYATSAEQICNNIKNNFNIYATDSNEFHFLVADSNKTFVIEFINNVTKVTQLTSNTFITNFHIEGIEVNNGILNYNSVSRYAMGTERYQYLLDNQPFNTLTSIKNCLSYLKYTHTYTETEFPWYTEFVGKYKDYDLTALDAKTNPQKYTDILTKARQLYANRTRDGKTWQTVHSSIYDLSTKTLYIGVQENPIAYSFTLTNDYNIL